MSSRATSSPAATTTRNIDESIRYLTDFNAVEAGTTTATELV